MENAAVEDDRCPICYEQLNDPRMLPCWHRACYTCILGMTQTGQGRAVSCCTCRKTLLFENIRCLPNPIVCGLCNKSVMNPKRFQCCGRLFCRECVREVANLGQVQCPACHAPDRLYATQEIPDAKLCPICFLIHVKDVQNCDHSLCGDCERRSYGTGRGCEVCEAVASPSPVPVNPLDNTGNLLGMGILAIQFQQMNLAPLQNAFQGAAPRQQPRRNDPTAVGLKAIFFLFMMVWTLWVHGLCATTWVICVLTLKAVRLSLLHCIGIIYITCIIMFIASLMCYFWHSLAYLSLFTAYNKTFAHRPWIISLSTGLGLCCFVVAYLESIFIHRMLLEFTLGLMVGVGGRV